MQIGRCEYVVSIISSQPYMDIVLRQYPQRAVLDHARRNRALYGNGKSSHRRFLLERVLIGSVCEYEQYHTVTLSSIVNRPTVFAATSGERLALGIERIPLKHCALRFCKVPKMEMMDLIQIRARIVVVHETEYHKVRLQWDEPGSFLTHVKVS